MAMEENPALQPPLLIIDTLRLRLKTLQMSDLDQVMPILSKLEVMQWTKRSPISDRGQAARWLGDRALGSDVFNFAIQLKDGNDQSNSHEGPENEPLLIGILGSFHWPSVGYLLHPSFMGNGYATEALRAFIPAFFTRVPTASEGGIGFDFMEACTDSKNAPSINVLRKCGFELCGLRERDFESAIFGVRDTVLFRVARPGKTLEELGLKMAENGGLQEEEAPEPPIQ